MSTAAGVVANFSDSFGVLLFARTHTQVHGRVFVLLCVCVWVWVCVVERMSAMRRVPRPVVGAANAAFGSDDEDDVPRRPKLTLPPIMSTTQTRERAGILFTFSLYFCLCFLSMFFCESEVLNSFFRSRELSRAHSHALFKWPALFEAKAIHLTRLHYCCAMQQCALM